MAGKADLIGSVADLGVEVSTFEVLPFGLDPYGAAGAAADLSTDRSGTIDPNGGLR